MFWAGGGGGGGGRCWDYSAIWAIRGMGDPKGYGSFGLFMCEKGVNFIHVGLIKGVFFTLAWHWVLNTY